MTSVPDEAQHEQWSHRDPDAFDPMRYLDGVIPFWLGGLEARCHYAFDRAGFEIERLLINADDTQAGFSLRRSQDAALVTVEEALTILRQALIAADCRCGAADLTLAVEDRRWEGTYAPIPPEDYFDPMDYIGQLPPVPEG